MTNTLRCAIISILVLTATIAGITAISAAEDSKSSDRVESLLQAGRSLADRTHYLEALDHFNEARDLLDRAGLQETRIYGDIVAASAKAKIKGRLHQQFPAQYVKMALREAQLAVELREMLKEVPPQQLAESYFLEGFIQKRFFRRTDPARESLEKAVRAYPGFAAAKRELGELKLQTKKEKDR